LRGERERWNEVRKKKKEKEKEKKDEEEGELIADEEKKRKQRNVKNNIILSYRSASACTCGSTSL
jgi:hypothetical protein